MRSRNPRDRGRASRRLSPREKISINLSGFLLYARQVDTEAEEMVSQRAYIEVSAYRILITGRDHRQGITGILIPFHRRCYRITAVTRPSAGLNR